ncbi:MAG: heme biosynthesis HemY N-terminal domain-containing protein [Pontibacterium sp.]
MKKLFLILLVVLAAGTWIGKKMIQDPGYVLLAYGGTTVEMSLWVFVIAFVLVFLALHWLLNISANALLPVTRLQAWRLQQLEAAAHKKTLRGLSALAEGHWAKAQRHLSQGSKYSEMPMINYLAAARAADEQGDTSTADFLLGRALEVSPEAEVAVGITQAQMQLKRGEVEPCLATLLKLQARVPKSPFVLRLLKDVYIGLNDWSALKDLLPTLRKQKVISENELATLELQTYGALLKQQVSNEQNAEELGSLWQTIPKNLQSNSALGDEYVALLISQQAYEKADAYIRQALKAEWSEALVLRFGTLPSSSAKRQLDVAREWLKHHANSPALNITLGRLCLRSEYWPDAQEYFEKALAVSTDDSELHQVALAELNRLLQHLGQEDQAQKLLQKNVASIVPQLPDLPQPSQ